MTDHENAPLPSPDDSLIADTFGERAQLAHRYHQWLAEEATVRGLIGPREVPKLWDRHILNSVLVSEVIPDDARVADIGSGAGLPGIPLALARPDVHVTLIEPLLRRTTFLNEVVEDLGLDNVTVVRGRAEDKAVLESVGKFDVVTSRAVAPLGKLAKWSLPLVKRGGVMAALKGSSAQEEIARDAKDIKKAGGGAAAIVELGDSTDATPTYAVHIRKR
ncbi:16S rRNA (guanine(527)-N(7))-methyltransferase RsmG [Corynebacterium sp. TAE3-ERU12]|uniref:16S rRNA (guanine(527)-N(7))-methyltransferase RsmG n=1 Tax=Corynebacterium sp. TAE3-ERU12 TaxID=2849491 RepID=UPI001C448149|nr:16S rRNA (guanine(527)-N(7))-methyltransferase RsmG [Corynebacterium sp. TAE3-ERU12]MBV7294340.1 16S rRNA (guanine(527)-N(7))-methyltransferase RsmG [Corynebacterium sp. TAE3-ERU12]